MRPTWEEYFMNIAVETAKRSTCDRLKVGAVYVRNNRILATGYNGSPSHMPHCDDVGHLLEDRHCVRTIHGEMNGIIQAAIVGISLFESELYLTHFPCYVCAKHLVQLKLWKLYYLDDYRNDERTVQLLKDNKIILKHLVF